MIWRRRRERAMWATPPEVTTRGEDNDGAESGTLPASGGAHEDSGPPADGPPEVALPYLDAEELDSEVEPGPAEERPPHPAG